jgi:hypothetical protein
MKTCKHPTIKCLVTLLLIVAMASMSLVPRIEAAFLPTEQSLPNQARQADLETVQKVLEHKMVAERLKDLGYSQEEIQTRLHLLPDDELHRFASQLDTLAPGGDVLGAIIAILLIVLLVVLILHLTGKRIVIG